MEVYYEKVNDANLCIMKRESYRSFFTTKGIMPGQMQISGMVKENYNEEGDSARG